VRRIVAWQTLLTLLLALLAPSGAVSASEAPEGTIDGSRAPLREDAGWSPSGGGHGMGLWFWPEGKRAYQLQDADTTGDYYPTLKAFDVVTGLETGTAPLSPPAWSSSTEWYSGRARHHTAAVDREGGRVFVAYRTDATSVSSGQETPCLGEPASGGTVRPKCVGGIHVFDGMSLEPLGRIRLDLSTVEGPRLIPIPRALEYSPADSGMGWEGRVLMVVDEVASGPGESGLHSAAGGSAVQNATPRRNGANIAYAVAFDPDSMRQEWAIRLEGCRNSREPRAWLKESEGHPTAVFRVGGAAPALYVGCHGNSAQQGVVVRVPLDSEGFPATLPVQVGDPVRDLDPDPDDKELGGLVAQAPRQEVFAGPDKVTVILADPASQRILMRVDDSGEVWWVFDGTVNQFLGTIGIGSYEHGHTTYGLDPDIGRLYVLAAPPLASQKANGPGGLYVADIRRNPLAQALAYPHLADTARKAGALNVIENGIGRAMSVEPRANANATRLYVTKSKENGGAFRVLLDETPAAQGAVADDAAIVRTLDINEAEGVTAATFDGTARGFGFRAILLGGMEGATRWGPADPIGLARGVPQFESSTGTTVLNTRIGADSVMPVTNSLPRPDPCGDAQRELVVAFVGPRGSAVVDASSSRGEAQPILADVRTREDAGAPVTRCGPEDWAGLWESALVSQPPMSEPGVEWPFADATSSCTATEEEQADSWSDPVVGAFSSRVECSPDEVDGWGQARGVGVDGVSVADTLSNFRIYLDPVRGMVARVESIARGVDIGGVVQIDTIRGVAESWANGHAAPDADEPIDATVFNPFNCDVERPAGTCFQRHVFGVRVAGPDGRSGYRCGPCGDEDALIEGMNRAFGANASARFREPNRELARGSQDGFAAAITKKDKERFSDIVLNADLLETMVPMLEVVRYAPHNRPSSSSTVVYSTGTPPRGRQVFQFAAVEVSSTYGIQCLLVYDEASNTCAAAKEEPGSITVSLTDPDGKALAGGAFEVRSDADTDGIVGLKDALLPNGACVTTDDGVGTCKFENLQPGSYLVSQVAAPPGYGKVSDPFVVELASGEARTVTFQNTSNVSTIAVSAADEAGKPVSGAVFAVYPDPDSDGKVAADAKPAASCTTDASGACSMSVPAGSYVLVQSSAPGGLEPIEPVAFTFASGGQTAAVGVVNYPAGGLPAVEPAPAPVEYSAPPQPVVTETVTDYTPAESTVADVPQVSIPEAVGGTIVRVIAAPGDALRLLSRDPKQAVAWTASLLLFALAVMAVRRRQQATELIVSS
jgi:hypothetical protein